MLSAQCVARNVRHCGRKGWRVPEWWEYPSCLKGRPGATRQADAHSVARPTIGLCERLLGQFLAMRNPPLASRARGAELVRRYWTGPASANVLEPTSANVLEEVTRRGMA